MNRQILQRRTEMLNYVCKGVGLQTIVEDLSNKYQVSHDAIYQDWHRRNQWMQVITQINDPTFIHQLIQGMQQIIPNAWYEYKTATNPSVKIGALRVAKECYIELIQILQSMGVAVKVPERIEVMAPWQNKFSSPQTDTNPTLDNESSITIDTASESSAAEDDGAKTTAQSTKPSNTASQAEA